MNLAGQLLKDFKSLRLVSKTLALQKKLDHIYTMISIMSVVVFIITFAIDMYFSYPLFQQWSNLAIVAYCLFSFIGVFIGTILLSSRLIKKLFRKFSPAFKKEEYEYDDILEAFKSLLDNDETFKHEIFSWVEKAGNTYLRQESIKDNRNYAEFDKDRFIKMLLNKDMVNILSTICYYQKGLQKVESFYEDPDKIKEFNESQQKYQKSLSHSTCVNGDIQKTETQATQNENMTQQEIEMQAGEFKKYL